MRIGRRRLPGGQQAEHDTDAERGDTGEQQRPTVQVDLGREGEVFRHQWQQRSEPAVRQDEAQGAAREREQHALGQDLPHQASAAGADGEAHRQLAAACGGPAE